MGIKTLEGIKISVEPKYEKEASLSSDDAYIWVYDIQIENDSGGLIQLMARDWKIIDSSGNIQELSGEGVVGKKPVISSGDKFEYSSYAQLSYPSGVMYGKYYFKNLNSGEMITVDIPAFSLDSPHENILVQ